MSDPRDELVDNVCVLLGIDHSSLGRGVERYLNVVCALAVALKLPPDSTLAAGRMSPMLLKLAQDSARLSGPQAAMRSALRAVRLHGAGVNGAESIGDSPAMRAARRAGGGVAC